MQGAKKNAFLKKQGLIKDADNFCGGAGVLNPTQVAGGSDVSISTGYSFSKSLLSGLY